MGLAPIPVTRIIQYARLEGIHRIDLFKNIMLDIDRGYMSIVDDKQKAESKKTKNKK